jgi:hypothetical protein
MKKLLFILGFILPVVLYGQNTFKYPVNANGGLRVGGADHSLIDSAKVVNSHFSLWRGSTPYYGISDTTGLEYIDGLTSDAQDQFDAITADIDTLQTDTVDIDDVALQLYQYALEPADSTADSTYNYVTHTQLSAIGSDNDFDLIMDAMATGLKAQTFGCDLGNIVSTISDMTDGRACYQAIYLKNAATLTGIKFSSAENGSFNQDNFNGCALYAYSSIDDTLRRVAISANDSTKWETPNQQLITFPFTGTYSASAGFYFIAYLYNCAGTASTTPELHASGNGYPASYFKISAYVASQTTLPEKLKLSDTTGNPVIVWGALY